MQISVEQFESMISPEPNSGCWLWDGGSYHNQGYGVLSIANKSHGAHRIAYTLYRGAIPLGMFVCHKCDVPACVNPAHLFIGTARDNTHDMIRKGRHGRKPPKRIYRGEANAKAKITAAMALQIYLSPDLQRDVAKRFGISQTLVWNIRNHRTWKHVTCGAPAR